MKTIYTIILSLIFGLTTICGYAQITDSNLKIKQERVESEADHQEQELSVNASFREVRSPAATELKRQIQPQARKFASMPDPDIDSFLKQMIRQTEKKNSTIRICTELQRVTNLPRW